MTVKGAHFLGFHEQTLLDSISTKSSETPGWVLFCLFLKTFLHLKKFFHKEVVLFEYDFDSLNNSQASLADDVVLLDTNLVYVIDNYGLSNTLMLTDVSSISMNLLICFLVPNFWKKKLLKYGYLKRLW